MPVRQLKVFVLLSTVALVACGSDSNEQAQSGDTENLLNTQNNDPIVNNNTAISDDRRWLLTSHGSETNETTPATLEAPFTFAFTYSQQNQISGFFGFDGCNVFSSGMVMVDGKVVMPVQGVNVDAASCGNLSFTEYLLQFDSFYNVISNTFSYESSPTELVLTALAGNSLTFQPCMPIDPNSLDSNCEPIIDQTAINVTEVRSGDLASLGNTIFSRPRSQVFRNQNELNEFNSSLVQCPCTIEDPPQVNFDESTILFVAHEITGSGGHSIEIVSAEVEGNNLSVEVQKHAPGENCSVDSAPTGPYKFYFVDGVYKNVDFVERPVLSPPCT